MFTHPSESYLIFEGRLTKADGTLYANADEVALTNNAIMHLFRRIEYHLSNQLIESLNYPGHATTMSGLLKYSDHFSKDFSKTSIYQRLDIVHQIRSRRKHRVKKHYTPKLCQ